jgi:hypothetical protein
MASRPAVIVQSTPPLPHIWAQLEWFGIEPVEGALYHWIADPDERAAWSVVELPDGSVICSDEPSDMDRLRNGHMGSDGETWWRLDKRTLALLLRSLR